MRMYDIPPFQERAVGLYLPPSDKLSGYGVTAGQFSIPSRYSVQLNELARRFGAEGQETLEILKSYSG